MARIPSLNLMIATIAIVFGSSFQLGYTYSWTNSAQTVISAFLKNSFFDSYGHQLDLQGESLLLSTIVTMKSLGLIVGAEIGKWVVPKFGALTMLKWNCVFMIAWSLLQELSWFVNRWEPLLIGRLLISVHFGIVLLGVPLFINEVAPKWCKGALSVFHSFMLNFGSLIASVLGMEFALGTADRWHWMLPVSCVSMLLLFLLAAFWLPESAYFFFVKKRNPTAARKSIEFYIKDENDRKEQWKSLTEGSTPLEPPLKDPPSEKPPLEPTCGSETEPKEKIAYVWDALRRPELRIPMLLLAAVALGKSCGGQSVVRPYSTQMFAAAGLSRNIAAYATVILFAESTLVTLVASYLTEKIGRKRLLYYSAFALAGLFACIMSVSLAAAAASIGLRTLSNGTTINDVIGNEKAVGQDFSNIAEGPQWAAYMVVGLFWLWPMLYSVGIGSLQTFVIVEVFPREHRPFGQAFNIQLTHAISFFAQFAYLPLQHMIGAYTYLPLFVVPLLTSGLITWKYFPADATSQQISDSAAAKIKSKKFSLALSDVKK